MITWDSNWTTQAKLYFMLLCVYLTAKKFQTVYIIFYSQIRSFIHFVTGLETGVHHWIEMSIANKLAKILSWTSWRIVVSYLAHNNFCEFIHGKLWVYLGLWLWTRYETLLLKLRQKYQYSGTFVHIANWHGGWHEASRYWGFVCALLRFQS